MHLRLRLYPKTANNIATRITKMRMFIRMMLLIDSLTPSFGTSIGEPIAEGRVVFSRIVSLLN